MTRPPSRICARWKKPNKDPFSSDSSLIYQKTVRKLLTSETAPGKKKFTEISVSRWYHGRLDRHAAEERLQHAGQQGSYLIRESDRKPGSYVLSFYGITGFNHFRCVVSFFSCCGDHARLSCGVDTSHLMHLLCVCRTFFFSSDISLWQLTFVLNCTSRITAMCGDYYIGGREFDTLSDLIGYYTCYSDLLKSERLQHPVPPPEVSTCVDGCAACSLALFARHDGQHDPARL